MKLTTKKTLWIFAMAIVLSLLGVIVSSRVKLSSEVIIGGAEGAFVESTGLKDPLYGYDEVGSLVIRAPKGLEYPNLDVENWRYILANINNSIKDYAPDELKETGQKGFFMDKNAVSSLNDLIEDAEKLGFSPTITSAYVSYDEQKELFSAKTDEVAAGGYTLDEAKEIAARLVERPGTSDHQTGLSVNIADGEYEVLPEYSEMDRSFFRWLDSHCDDYGFIKRYPSELKSLTGRDEPTHYRYVGKEAAQFITENGLCLEQLLAYYN